VDVTDISPVTSSVNLDSGL